MSEIKFQTLGENERKLLLTALGIDMRNLRCHYCRQKVDYKNCGIMPPVLIDKPKNATITCSSPLCISQYLDEMQE